MNRRFKVLFGVVALVALWLSASGSSSAQPGQASGRPAAPRAAGPVRVVVAVPADVSTLDVQNEPNTNASQLYQVFEGLVRTDENLQIQPGLATSWQMINSTSWEFKLRQGVKFHDGSPFTAKDVKWSYDRMMSSGAPAGPKKGYVGWFKEVQVVDDYTVRIITEGPYPILLRRLGFTPVIVSQTQFEKVGAAEFAKNPAGTGPFKIVSWKVNASLELAANPDYWRGRPVVDQLVFRVIPDESTRIAEMLTGGVDILIDTPLTRVSELKKTGNITITPKLGVLNFYLAFNTHQSPFDNLKVRQAIAHALDVPTMIQAVLGGYGHHANSLVHTTSFGWNPNLKPFAYDPALSQKLLAEAGFPNGFSTTLEAGPGVWPATQETSEAISGFLSAVGIQADVKISEFGTFFDKFRGTKLNAMFMWGNVSPTLDADQMVYLYFHCPPDTQGIYWCSKETDALIEQTRLELNPPSREKLFWQIQQILQDRVMAVPLWQYDQVGATNNRLKWVPRGEFFIHAYDIQLAQ